MAVTWLAPTDVTPGGLTGWQDVDNASVPNGAIAVLVRVRQTDAAATQAVGLRKNGSTDNRIMNQRESHTWAMIGVDGDGIFEVYRANAAVSYYLFGYVGSNATFQTNANDISENVTFGSFVDVNIATITGAETAIAACCEFEGGANDGFGVRKNGSTDNRVSSLTRRHVWVCIGVDASEIFEQNVESGTMNTFLNGWLTADATLNNNAADRSLTGVNTWTNLTALPSGATGGIYEIWKSGTTTGLNYGLRRNGDGEDVLSPQVTSHAWGLVEASALIVQGQIEDLSIDFWEVGYFTAAAAADELLQSRRMISVP